MHKHKVNVHEAKTHFSKLVESAMNGKETIIAKSGKPVAKLGPISTKKPKRRLGVLKGKIKIANDFDAPLPDDILNSFEGH
jgi:prevent-host-death family protein